MLISLILTDNISVGQYRNRVRRIRARQIFDFIMTRSTMIIAIGAYPEQNIRLCQVGQVIFTEIRLILTRPVHVGAG